MARALAAADQLGQLETVHLGHLHIQQGQGHVAVVEQQLQRLGAGLGLEEFDAVALQQRLDGDQVLGDVIDDQAFDAICMGHGFSLGI